MMKSSYVVHPGPRSKVSKPALYCASESGCLWDEVDVSVALCLRAHFRESRVAISIRYELVRVPFGRGTGAFEFNFMVRGRR